MRFNLLAGVGCLALSLALSPRLTSAEDQRLKTVGISDGSTVVFLGDSITYQAHYAEYVRDFFHTRYPDMRLQFVNAGIPGHKAADALARFDFDVARFKPAVVVILLGMNDGGYQDLDAGNRLSDYQANMTELVQRTTALGAMPVLISPTPFDTHTNQARRTDPTYRFGGKEFSSNYNYVLAYYGAWCRDLAEREGAIFVDAYGPMNGMISQRRLTDADFTLMPDAIHPDPAGHLLIALAIVQRLGGSREGVGRVVLDRHHEQWEMQSQDVHIRNLVGNDERISLEARASALPWLIPEKHTLEDLRWKNPSNGPEMYAATNAGHKFSAAVIQAVGLQPGNYSVRIDGVVVGQASHLQLAAGWELQGLEESPQYQQALEVARLNRRLSDEVVRPLRDLISQRLAAVRKGPQALAAFESKKGKAIEVLEQARNDLEEQIYRAAQPQWHQFEIALNEPNS